MLKRIVKFNQEGMVIPLSIGYQEDDFSYVSKEEKLAYINSGSKESYSWEYRGEKIIIEDPNASVYGYPTVDMNFMIVIYTGLNGEFSPPHNAVVYNLDGSVHKVLEIPKLVSPKIIEKIKEEKHSNPPIEDNRYGHYGMGLEFVGFGWKKDKDGNLVNTISIKYLGEYGEWRIFNPITGEFGEMTTDWYQSRGWR
jgi:hypothetical protein